ncbi:MAG: hypothetical protein WA140_11720, partial [Geobacteraceae bacterium]
VTVILVVKLLEILALPFEHGIACEPLAAKKLFVIGIVEALYYGIPLFIVEQTTQNGGETRCQ